MGNITETLDDLAEVANKEAEELGGGRDESEVQVPVAIPTPDDEVMDPPRLKRKVTPCVETVEVQTQCNSQRE